VGLLSAGCLQDKTYLDPDQNAGFNNTSASTMQLRDGSLRGDFGGRRGFNGEATRLEGSNDPAYGMTVVNVVREQQDTGAAMVILSISGKTLDQYEVGEHAFHYDESSLNTNEQVFANVCSSAGSSDSFDYDAPAQDGTITIEDSPEGLRNVQVHTETPVVDGSGVPTGDVEITDSAFSFPMQG
jgi:hypothetical protein